MPQAWPDEVANLVKKVVNSSGGISDIRRALKAIVSLSKVQQGPKFKLGICRTFTLETQIDALRLGLSTIPCRPNIFVGELDNIEQILLNGNSQLLQAEPDAILVLWRLEELHPRLLFEYDGMSSEDRELSIISIIERIEKLCVEYEGISNAPLFLSTLPEIIDYKIMSDVSTSYSPRHAVLRINQALFDLARRFQNIRLFDLSGWVSYAGRKAFDIKMDLYARQPISNASLISFADYLSNTFRSLVCAPAKVLALDLDNVLWGGILGEDGYNGLRIGHDFPGNIYRRIQLQALALKNRGVLLVLLSKNNLTDVEEAFSVLPDMPLRLNNFSAIRVNWNEKGENIKNISHELNLGLDSFVFIDDQKFEREQMRFYAPDVHVLNASEDPLANLSALMNCHLFNSYRVSDEDRNRSADYIAQKQRKKLKSENGDPKEFLYSLQLQAKITPVTDVTIPRAVQMLAKTNQFNVTTRRHTEADLTRMLADKMNTLLLLSLSDRFSEQGIVGLVIALGDDLSKTVKVDSFLLSCRAIGRGAEYALWSSLLSCLSQKGFQTLHADYYRTNKNSLVEKLYEDFGLIKKVSSNDECYEFTLELPSYSDSPKWIEIEKSI